MSAVLDEHIRMATKIVELIALLRSLEWSAYRIHAAACCPCCAAMRDDGVHAYSMHESHCALALAIDAPRRP